MEKCKKNLRRHWFVSFWLYSVALINVYDISDIILEMINKSLNDIRSEWALWQLLIAFIILGATLLMLIRKRFGFYLLIGVAIMKIIMSFAMGEIIIFHILNIIIVFEILQITKNGVSYWKLMK